MNSRIQNQLTTVGSCITVAYSTDHKPVWFEKDPADFGTDLVLLQTGYGTLTAKAALAEAAAGGAADAKAVAETSLEDAAYILARALAVHFKKTGNLTVRAQVDVSKSELVKLRTQELVNKTTAIRDLAAAAVSEPNADKRGVTAARGARAGERSCSAGLLDWAVARKEGFAAGRLTFSSLARKSPPLQVSRENACLSRCTTAASKAGRECCAVARLRPTFGR